MVKRIRKTPPRATAAGASAEPEPLLEAGPPGAQPPAAPSPPGKLTRHPWFGHLTLALLPLILIAVLFGGLWYYLVAAPAGAAKARISTPLPPVDVLLITPVEEDRLERSLIHRKGVWVEDVKPWEIPEEGIGAISGTPEERASFMSMLRSVMGNPESLKTREDLETALAPGGESDMAVRPYVAALYYHKGGQPDLALAQAEETLRLIASARKTNRKAPAALVKLDGEEIAVQYLKGHILRSQGKAADAEKAFEKALNLALKAVELDAYNSVPSPNIFSLKPEHHLVAFSTATLWNDYLRAIEAARPGAAWKIAHDRKLYADVQGVKTSRPLAATLQYLAAVKGERKTVEELDAGDSPDAAGEVREAARLVAGVSTDTARLENTRNPGDAALFRPWAIIALERPELAGVEALVQSSPIAGAGTPAESPDLGFLDQWREQYTEAVGRSYLKLGNENPAYFEAILRSGRYPSGVKFAAATRSRGLHPAIATGIFVLVGLLAIPAIIWAFMYISTFRPLHYGRRWAKRNDPNANWRRSPQTAE